MNKETKDQVASALMELASMAYHFELPIPERTQAVACFAKSLLPIFTERANSTAYGDALRELKSRGRNSREFIADLQRIAAQQREKADAASSVDK